jgi:hypothetical protein
MAGEGKKFKEKKQGKRGVELIRPQAPPPPSPFDNSRAY